MLCRICSYPVQKVLDLGSQPIANSLLVSQDMPQMHYPLEFYWCKGCLFGQVNDLGHTDIFNEDYPYYSSVNTSYVTQCKIWALDYLNRFDPKSVLEIGCNDGYLLENFKHLYHVGVEPSRGPAKVSEEKGINVVHSFFSSQCEFGKFDLIIANNVIAHTPHLQDVVKGIAQNLTPTGTVVVEFPPVNDLIEKNYYDTIYHEHFSYFSITAIWKLFRAFGLHLKSWEPIPSHGGSIRAYFNHREIFEKIESLNIGIDEFPQKVFKSKLENSIDILARKIVGKKLALFGAAAKGISFLNYLGIKSDIFDFCVDETPAKQGKYLPGSRIPIVGIETLKIERPDYLYVLPWNFKDEIMAKTSFISEWKGQHIGKL